MMLGSKVFDRVCRARWDFRKSAAIIRSMTKLERILKDLVHEYSADGQNKALLLTGSVARGDASPLSDVDLIAVRDDAPGFTERTIDGILIEIKAASLEAFRQKMSADAMNVYQFLDATALFDRDECLRTLKAHATDILARYEPPRAAILKWLTSADQKMRAATEAERTDAAAFLLATNTWELLTGLYAINRRPVPPSTNALRLLPTLPKLPEGFREEWNELLLAPMQERIKAWQSLCQYVVIELQRS